MKRQFLILIAIILLTLSGVNRVWAQEGNYPQPGDLYVNDFAQVLDGDEQAALTAILQDVRNQHGIEMTVLTVDSYKAYNTGDSSLESFSTNLFNDWGIGNATRNDGVLIFLALAEREVRVELGSGYEESMNREAQVIITEFMIPRFREGEFGDGLYRGSRAFIFELTGEQPADVLAGLRSGAAGSSAAVAPSLSNPVTAVTDDDSSIWENTSGGSVLITFLLGLLGGGGMLIRRVWSNFSRTCDECGSDMVKLSETADDAYLDPGQRKEEQIGSMNYDVWHCQSCGEHSIKAKRKWFSGYSRCPECHYRTASSTSKTIKYATYSSRGTEEITATCRKCNYHDVKRRSIPRKTRSSSGSSSSGGGSFGGGSSSGGGASGSW